MFLSVCLYVFLFVCLFVCLLYVCMSVYASSTVNYALLILLAANLKVVRMFKFVMFTVAPFNPEYAYVH